MQAFDSVTFLWATQIITLSRYISKVAGLGKLSVMFWERVIFESEGARGHDLAFLLALPVFML